MSKSPSPNRFEVIVLCDFPDAMQALIDGNRVTRQEWANDDVYGMMREGWLEIRREDGWHVWQVGDGDMLAEDWIVMD